MSTGELPARLVFLHDLADCSPQEKVRFLCCIAQNRTSPGYFYAQHDYPRGSLHPTVIVDIEHTLETASTSDLQPGKWVNIIGYITKLRSDRSQGEVAQGSEAGVRVHVQALMIWSAGSPKLNHYEEALQLRKDTDNL